jgi:hypothetical protein
MYLSSPFSCSRHMSSGVTLLASKLSAYQRSHRGVESVKLSDSVAYSPHLRSPALSTPTFESIDSLKDEIDRLLAQTVQQEQALIHFHAESVRAQDEYNILRTRLMWRCICGVKKRVILETFGFLRATRPIQTRKSTLMVESVNLNETLKLLALQLESPTADTNSSILLSSSAPFSISRRHFRK